MNRHQGKATTITSDRAKGGYAPERRPTPPYLTTPPHHVLFLLPLLTMLFLLPQCTKKPPVVTDFPVVVQVFPDEPISPVEPVASDPIELVGVDPAVVEEKVEPVFKAVYFDFDGVELRDDTRNGVAIWISKLWKIEGAVLVLEGHADSRGSVQYNFGLGQKRAVAVKRYMESKGVGNRIRCVSYGESRPVQEGCEAEDCFQENRRVELRIEKAGIE